MAKRLQYIALFIFAILSNDCFSQLVEYGINRNINTGRKINHSYAREQATDTVSLPFFDDFSFSNGQPADSLWDTSGVYINNGYGINPPSIGVATFDGIQSDGTPYSFSSGNIGKTDSLVSTAIDLSTLTVTDDVFLSFFYQYGGNGDAPDLTDSIRLEFLNKDSIWVNIWPLGNDLITTGNFNQVIEKVGDPSFFHEGFRFKFITFGRQSGSFDVWNLDYMYMNQDRSPSDLEYPDRTIVSSLPKIFTGYTAIPYSHFDTTLIEYPTVNFNTLFLPAPTNYLVYGSVDFYENDSTLSDVKSFLSDSVNTTIFPVGQQTNDIPPVLSGIDFPQGYNSAVINLNVEIFAGDGTADDDEYTNGNYFPITFQTNDLVSRQYQLSDYYAYDDGAAESAAGLLNGEGKSIAYRYDMTIEEGDSLTAIDIYFPYINSNPSGKEIQLTVWQNIDTADAANNVVVHRQITTVGGSGINEFVRYDLTTPIKVEGSFFIGYKQNAVGDLGIGLDKNTDSSDKIYFNIDDRWRVNTLVEGSLMMRPVFGPIPDKVTTSVYPLKLSKLKVYPNPNKGKVFVSEPFQDLKLYDLRGVEQKFTLQSGDQISTLNIENLPAGIYLLKVTHREGTETIRIIREID